MSRSTLSGIMAALAVVMLSSAAMAATFTPRLMMTTIRIEPPRPGGLNGLARGWSVSRDIGVDAALSDKSAQAHKRRKR